MLSGRGTSPVLFAVYRSMSSCYSKAGGSCLSRREPGVPADWREPGRTTAPTKVRKLVEPSAPSDHRTGQSCKGRNGPIGVVGVRGQAESHTAHVDTL